MQRMLLVLPLLAGCAVRGTVNLTKGEQELYNARAVDASERAVFEWTLAEQYQLKSREEWGYADYEAAEKLAAKSAEWSLKAQSAAAQQERVEQAEGMGDFVPEEMRRNQRAPAPMIKNRGEVEILIPGEDEEEDEE